MLYAPAAPIARPAPAGVPRSPGREPSRYQQAIYDWVRSGSGDALVDAVPGSGKTTTLVEASALIQGDGLFVAFNRHIADELRARLPAAMDASTIHALGLKTLSRAGLRPAVTSDKYRRLALAYYTGDRGLDSKTAHDLVDLALPVVRLAQLTLTDPADVRALWSMAGDYDLDVTSWEQVAPAIAPILERGVASRQATIDFNDMVWLPHVLGLTPARYEWVMVDEAQDLNAAQRELVLRARRPGGRVIAVGDCRQSMYHFAGADSSAMDRIAARTGATTLPLSISYRLPRSHAALVNSVYNTVEVPPWAIEGTVEAMDEDAGLGLIRIGDMVLCRLNAPLVAMAYRLIRRGVPVRVRGRDIGTGLARLVRSLEKQPGFTVRGLPDALAAYVARLEREQRDAGGSDARVAMAIASAQDRAATIQVIADATRPHDTAALKEAILALFADEEGRYVSLSTVHKAKGLEAERVWIVAPEKMPHPKATSPQQRIQEENIRYVAFSRAKEALYFQHDGATGRAS